MFNFKTANVYNCQPESAYATWRKGQNMAFCDGFFPLTPNSESEEHKGFINTIITFILK